MKETEKEWYYSIWNTDEIVNNLKIVVKDLHTDRISYESMKSKWMRNFPPCWWRRNHTQYPLVPVKSWSFDTDLVPEFHNQYWLIRHGWIKTRFTSETSLQHQWRVILFTLHTLDHSHSRLNLSAHVPPTFGGPWSWRFTLPVTI